VHLAFRTSTVRKKLVREFAEKVRHKKILEVGSGPKSLSGYFDPSNYFLASDIRPDLGYVVVDVTKMEFEEEFDVILCLNVLEHVFDFQLAIANLRRALRRGGTLVVACPTCYPLHDEPGDYWRFTEHALRRLLTGFEVVRLEHGGLRRLPFWHYVEAIKR